MSDLESDGTFWSMYMETSSFTCIYKYDDITRVSLAWTTMQDLPFLLHSIKLLKQLSGGVRVYN